MTVDATYDFNALSEGATVGTSGSFTISGVAPVALAAALAHGARGARWASTSSPGRVQYDYGSAQTARAVVLSYYFNIRTMGTGAIYLGGILSAPSGGTVSADWRVNTNMTVTVRNYVSGSGISIGVSSPTLSLNTWYRAEWKVSEVTGTQEMRVYIGENTAPLFTISGNYGGSSVTRVAGFGPIAAGAGGAVDIDTLRPASDFTGAFAGGGGGPTPPTPVTQTFDSQTLGSPISLSAPWATNGSVPNATAAAAMHGAAGVAYTAGTAGRVQHDLGAAQTAYPVYTSSYFRIIAMPTTAALYLGAVLDLPTGGAVQADWRVNQAMTVTLRNDPGTGLTSIGTSGSVLALNTWYRSEWSVDDTGNTQTLKIFAGESLTPLFTLSGAYSSTGTRVLAFGPLVAYAGGSVQLDTLRVDAAWPGPFGTPSGPTPPPPALMTFDSETPNAPITLSAPWSVSGTAPDALATARMHGAVGVYWDDLTAGRRVQYDYGSNITASPVVLGGYFRVHAWPTSANLSIAMVTSLTSGGTVQADIRIDAAGRTMTMRNNGTPVATSPLAEPISIDTWYRFEWMLDDTANTQELRVYFNEFSSVNKFTISGSYTGVLTRVAGFGPYLAAAGGQLEMDTLRLDSGWLGPYQAVERVRYYCSSVGVMVPVETYLTK